MAFENLIYQKSSYGLESKFWYHSIRHEKFPAANFFKIKLFGLFSFSQSRYIQISIYRNIPKTMNEGDSRKNDFFKVFQPKICAKTAALSGALSSASVFV